MRAWTKATRPKCCFSKRLRQIRTPENFELKRQRRNEATKQRRITIRNIGVNYRMICVKTDEILQNLQTFP